MASGIWPHGRYRFDFAGEANHAGSTRMEDRHDPMLSYAMTALAANKQARLGSSRATFGRIEVEPNGTNAVPSRVTAWLDARSESPRRWPRSSDEVTRLGTERAGRDGTSLTVTPESVSGAVAFDPALAARIAADHEGGDWPLIPTQAGHDAGILSMAGVPTAMLFVRNPTGVSHSPGRARRDAPTAWWASPPWPTRSRGWRGERRGTARRTCSSAPGSDGAVRDDVLVEVEDGRFTRGEPGARDRPRGDASPA